MGRWGPRWCCRCPGRGTLSTCGETRHFRLWKCEYVLYVDGDELGGGVVVGDMTCVFLRGMSTPRVLFVYSDVILLPWSVWLIYARLT